MFSLAFLMIRGEADRELVKDLFEKYEQMMYKKAYSILHNRTDAEDTVQDTMIKIIDGLEKIRILEGNEVGYYLTSMTKNAAYDMLRKKTRLPESNVMVELNKIESDISIEDITLTKIDSERINEALKKLPDNEYEILFWNLRVGYSPSEIAVLLGISPNAARQRIYRAKMNLKTQLEKEGITNDV